MKEFLSRFGSLVTGVLSGFDRLVFRGCLMPLMRRGGLEGFLGATGIRLLDFGPYAKATTEQVKQASLAEARENGRPIQYLDSPRTDKEALARDLLAKHPVEEGLICVLTALEPCMTFEYHRSAQLEERGYRLRPGKCLHLYKYYRHPRYGFMHARIQTWFPFNVQIYLNGREWLARRLDVHRIEYERVDNCFTHLGDPEGAQRLMDGQLATPWPRALDNLALSLNPQHPLIFKNAPTDYYWTAYQTEWATDLMFKNAHSLAELYPVLVRHAMEQFKSPDVMRFLGGKVHPNFTGEIISSFKNRPEGVRVKHFVRGNSVKMYDKASSVLRVETTLGNTTGLKVLRPPHDEPKGKLKWQPLRKGIADLHRRAELSQKANDAYLDALSVVDDTTPCSKLFDAVSRPVILGNGHVRPMRLNAPGDLALLEAIARGEFTTTGFRNRDITALLFPAAADADTVQRRRIASRTTRFFRMLRAHGIIKKVPKTHRYRVTIRGQLLIAALFASRSSNVKELRKAA
jgi:hypothetical protein